MRRHLVAALLVAASACQCSQRYHVQSLSREATQVFSRTNAPDTGGSLVVDFEQLRVLGVIEPGDPKKDGSALVDLALFALPSLATQLKDEALGPVAARAAVLVAVLRESADRPHVQRLGVVVPTLSPLAGVMGMVDDSAVLLAVQGDKKANQELLQSLAAVDRASGTKATRTVDGDLCVSAPGGAAPVGVCVRAGDGFFALSTESGIKRLLPPAGQPEPAMDAPALMRLKLNMPEFGKGEIVAEAKAGLRLAASLQTSQPEVAAELERVLADALKKMDEQRALTRTVMAPALADTQKALAEDGEAPARMKTAAQKMSVETLLDPTGSYAQLRSSIKLSRKDANLSAELTVPEALVRKALEDSSLLTTVAVAGVVAAVALPNFTKYECASKQSEAKAQLKAAFVAQKTYFESHDRYGADFPAIGFDPLPNSLYSYCMNGRCTTCGKAGCVPDQMMENPCQGMTMAQTADDAEGIYICAVGDPDGDADPDDLDIWTISDDGEPRNVVNGCE